MRTRLHKEIEKIMYERENNEKTLELQKKEFEKELLALLHDNINENKIDTTTNFKKRNFWERLIYLFTGD